MDKKIKELEDKIDALIHQHKCSSKPTQDKLMPVIREYSRQYKNLAGKNYNSEVIKQQKYFN